MSTGLAASLSRSMDLLEIASRAEGMPFSAATAALGTVPSTVSRLLKALAASGLIEHGADGRYRATSRVRRMAGGEAGPDLAHEAIRAAEQLADATGQSAAVFTPVADGVRLIAKSEPPERFRYMAVDGVNRDCHRHGFCVLRSGWWDSATLRRQLLESAPSLPVATALERAKRARANGWLVNRQDDQPGMGRIVVACQGARGQLAALVGITATASAIAARRSDLLAAVRASAATLATRLRISP